MEFHTRRTLGEVHGISSGRQVKHDGLLNLIALLIFAGLVALVAL